MGMDIHSENKPRSWEPSPESVAFRDQRRPRPEALVSHGDEAPSNYVRVNATMRVQRAEIEGMRKAIANLHNEIAEKKLELDSIRVQLKASSIRYTNVLAANLALESLVLKALAQHDKRYDSPDRELCMARNEMRRDS